MLSEKQDFYLKSVVMLLIGLLFLGSIVFICWARIVLYGVKDLLWDMGFVILTDFIIFGGACSVLLIYLAIENLIVGVDDKEETPKV